MSVVPLHRDRAATIGGSDIAAAAGIDPYCSPVMLWLEKTGRYQRPKTEAMRWGTLLEPVIFDALRDEYPATVHYRHLEVVDPDRPWLVGHPDGMTEATDGSTFVVETKATNAWTHRANGGVPLHHAAQGQLYCHLADTRGFLLAVLVNGAHLETHEVPRDDRAIALLLDAAERFRWHVVTDTQPAVGASDSDREALAILYPESAPARRVRLDAEGMRLVRELRARKEQAGAVAEQVQALENELKALMGDAEIAVSPNDDDVIRWSAVTTNRFDTKRFRAERPELAELFTSPSTSRRFTVL